MTIASEFPAWLECNRDSMIRAHPTALSVYACLVSDGRPLAEPRPAKVRALAHILSTSDFQGIAAALELLLARGYIVQHGRTGRGVRLVSLVADRSAKPNLSAA